jgi:hypothetical protein
VTSSSEVFEHPALTAAAVRLASLRAAAGRIGAPDPVAALRHLDCSPSSINASASAVDAGALLVTSASAEFRSGVERAVAGGSAETFATVDSQYAAAVRAAAETAALGARIASELDALATSAASEVSTLADSASTSVAAVLAGDRSAEVVSTVSVTCTSVVRVVSAKVASLSSLAAELEPMTTPAVELS